MTTGDPTMTLDQALSLLARLARDIVRIQEGAVDTVAHLLDRNPEYAEATARRCQDQATAAARALAVSGIALPNMSLPAPDLAALTSRNTAEARDLLRGLEALLPLAERVDAQRGRVVEVGFVLQPGESRGTDLAESLTALTMGLRAEIRGERSGR